MSFDATALAAAIAAHGPVVRVVVAEVQGSAPREVGAAMLVWPDGQSGTVGGGALEFQATQAARDMLAAGEARRFTRVLLGPDMGQCCGGAVALLSERFDRVPELGTSFVRPVAPVEAGANAPDKTDLNAIAEGASASDETARDAVEEGAPAADETPPDGPGPRLDDGWFIEPVAPATTPVWIWGAGHVGRALAAVLGPLPGLAVTLIDSAPERFPAPIPPCVTARIAPGFVEAVAEAPQGAHHYILTYSHDADYALCDALLAHGFAHAGLIGSATKWARFRSRLGQKGHSPAAIDRIFCPIGDPSLGKHPQAIAVGVAHALIMDMAKKEAQRPLAG